MDLQDIVLTEAAWYFFVFQTMGQHIAYSLEGKYKRQTPESRYNVVFWSMILPILATEFSFLAMFSLRTEWWAFAPLVICGLIVSFGYQLIVGILSVVLASLMRFNPHSMIVDAFVCFGIAVIAGTLMFANMPH